MSGMRLEIEVDSGNTPIRGEERVQLYYEINKLVESMGMTVETFGILP